jgi:O-antigen/teichoic acid export membrane protein
MKDRLAKSVFWMVWSRGVVQAVSFLCTLVVARLLSPEDYGLMAMVTIWTYALALIAEMGLGAAIVQFRDLEEGELNMCFWLSVAAAGISYLLLYISAPALATWFNNATLTDILRVAGLSLPFVAIRIVPEGLLRRRLELDKISQAEIVSTVMAIPVVMGMAWSGAGVWALVAGALIVPSVQSIVSFWFVGWCPGLRLVRKRLRKILEFSLARLGSGVGWAAYQQLDILVLGKTSGDAVLGFYFMAKLLAHVAVEKVSVVVIQIATPVLAALQEDRRAMRVSFLRALRLTTCLTVPLCIGMALVADDLVWTALTEKWLPMVPVLQVLCLFAVIRSIDVLLPPVLFARYRVTFLFWWVMAVLLIMSFAFWAGAVWRGALGVAVACLVVYPFIVVWLAREAFRELELGWSTLWQELKPIVIAVLIMAAFVLSVRWTMPGFGFVDRLVRLALASGFGAIVYGAVIWWSAGSLRREIVEVAGWLLRRHHLPLDGGQILATHLSHSNIAKL